MLEHIHKPLELHTEKKRLNHWCKNNAEKILDCIKTFKNITLIYLLGSFLDNYLYQFEHKILYLGKNLEGLILLSSNELLISSESSHEID